MIRFMSGISSLVKSSGWQTEEQTDVDCLGEEDGKEGSDSGDVFEVKVIDVGREEQKEGVEDVLILGMSY